MPEPDDNVSGVPLAVPIQPVWDFFDPVSVDRALRWSVACLREVAEHPRLEAERLLAAVLQVDRPVLIAHPDLILRPAQVRILVEATRRRQHGMPLPYILGSAEFFGLEFVVTPDVLIPRPETELLVEQALGYLKGNRDTGSELVVVDVGTGSGCIAVALAAMLPALRVIGVDIDASALAVARVNSFRHGVHDRIQLLIADLLSPIVGPIDVLVSNPPYVAEREWAGLPVSVQQEPSLALLAGPEGLAVIWRLLEQARERLSLGGVMLVEIGCTQGNAVRTLAQDAFPDACVEILSDLAGLDRLLFVRT